ncbi:MAG: ribosomal-protein-alanine N-acetyltransferase [Pseudomonadota bacterium]|jgi:ribosomal-protein-alanine N-acetyltransferase
MPVNVVDVRAMTSEDVTAVAAIERMVQFHPWTSRQFVESLESGQRCTVAVLDQHVVGFCILQPVLDEANLLLMGVTPTAQGRGVGFQLLDTSIEQLGDGCVMVFLEVRTSNTAALALYEKGGFHRMGVRKHYYPVAGGGKEDAVLMALTRGNPFA